MLFWAEPQFGDLINSTLQKGIRHVEINDSLCISAAIQGNTLDAPHYFRPSCLANAKSNGHEGHEQARGKAMHGGCRNDLFRYP